MRRSVFAVFAAVTLVAFPAAAESRDEARSAQTVRISLASYDLQSQASVAELYQDITETAASLCAELNHNRADRAWCERRAVNEAIAEAHVAPLSRYHATGSAAEAGPTLALR